MSSLRRERSRASTTAHVIVRVPRGTIAGRRAWTSAALSPSLAVASGIAFALSELLDFAVYTPLRRWNWLVAVALSNTVGLIADSVLFLMLAFGSLDFLSGQVVGKLWMTLLAVALPRIWRRRLAPVTTSFQEAPLP